MVSSFEDTAKVEGTRKGEVASEWRLNPHFSFILTSRTSAMPVAFRINTYSVSSCINIDRVKRKERVMYVYTYIYSRADAVRLHTA